MGAFVGVGVASSAAVAVMAYSVMSFRPPMLPGIAEYLALRSTVRGWRGVDANAAQPTAAASPATGLRGMRRGACTSRRSRAPRSQASCPAAWYSSLWPPSASSDFTSEDVNGPA